MLKALSLAALLALASPAFAQDASCPVTLDTALAQMKAAGVPDSSITVSDDVAFIAAYHHALRITIPDGSHHG